MMPAAKASGHYVNSILAGYEARRGCTMKRCCWTPGFVAEGSGEDVFVGSRRYRQDPVADKHPAGNHPGLSDQDSARRGIEVREELFPRDAFYVADEAFMTGTAAEVTPVVEAR